MHNNTLSAHVSRRTSRFLKLMAVVGLSGAVLFSTGCAKLRSRDQMNKGVQAYKGQKYADAVKHFQEAVKLDPTSQNARLYLATSYMVQWVPGADTPENNRNFDMAEQTFEQTLQQDPNNSLALGSLAFMAYNKASSGTPEEKHAALEKAREWNKKRIQANPNDPEPYYYLGVIDFNETYPAINTARVDEDLKDTDPGPIHDKMIRDILKQRYLDLINSGIENLQKCISLDPTNDAAMDYINLLLRNRAAVQDTPELAQADFAKANDWFNKSTAMHKKNAEEAKKQKAQNG